jgi:hypothetical protein
MESTATGGRVIMPQQNQHLVDKFWDMGNYIAAFAAVQMAAFLLAVGSQQHFLELIRSNWRAVVSIMVILNVVAYVGGVWSCFLVERRLRAGGTCPAWLAVAFRTGWVVVFTAVGALSVYLAHVWK